MVFTINSHVIVWVVLRSDENFIRHTLERTDCTINVHLNVSYFLFLHLHHNSFRVRSMNSVDFRRGWLFLFFLRNINEINGFLDASNAPIINLISKIYEKSRPKTSEKPVRHIFRICLDT